MAARSPSIPARTNLVSGPDGNYGQLFVKDVSSLYPAPLNHAPVANADSFTVVGGTPLQMGGAGVRGPMTSMSMAIRCRPCWSAAQPMAH